MVKKASFLLQRCIHCQLYVCFMRKRAIDQFPLICFRKQLTLFSPLPRGGCLTLSLCDQHSCKNSKCHDSFDDARRHDKALECFYSSEKINIESVKGWRTYFKMFVILPIG